MGPSSGVVVVRRSKSGLRFDMDESVALYDTQLPRLWDLCLLERIQISRPFHEGLHALSLGYMGFQPYSIRRDGATHSFATSLALDRWTRSFFVEDGAPGP